jgi:hypothetical protein
LNKQYPVPNKKAFYEFMKNKKYDFVVTSTRFYFLSLYGNKWARKNNVRTAHLEHGTRHTKTSNPIVFFVSRLVDCTIGRYIIKNSWKVFGVSKAAKRFAMKLYKRPVGIL